MKALSTILILLCSAMLLAILPGCLTSTGGDLLAEGAVPPSLEISTKTDIYRIFGVPDTIRKAGENIDYYYVFTRASGGGVGLGSAFIGFNFRRRHKADDTIVFRIDPQGKVISVKQMQGMVVLRGTFWPFGS